MNYILLCCASTISTSILVNSMKEEAKSKKIETIIWAVGETALDIAWPEADIILLSPQIRHLLPSTKELVKNRIPVIVIDEEDFIKMDGKKVLDIALNELQKTVG